MRNAARICGSRLVAVALAVLPAAAAAGESRTTAAFKGNAIDEGTVTHSMRSGQSVLTLSDDFKVPEDSDAHWRVVDSKGMGYLLQRLSVKPDRVNRMIVVPQHVKDVSKVQIWDAGAETLLGEASFGSAVATRYNPASAKAMVKEGLAYDDTRMRPRDDATASGTTFVPLEYDDRSMRFRETQAQGRNPRGAKPAEQVEYDEKTMRPNEN